MKRKVFYLFITILAFSIGVSAVFYWCFDRKVEDKSEIWKRVLSFEDQNLSKLSNEQKIKLFQDFYRLFDKEIYAGYGEEVLFSKISNENNQKYYVLIGEEPLVTIPGDCGLYFQIFDSSGNHINSLSFKAGWRIDLKDIKIRYSSEIGREIVEVSSEPVINGRDIVKQFYALVGKEILLIRLENSKGQAVKNDYTAPNFTIGLNISGRSENYWENSLKSGDSANLLASLTWLNGIHINPEKLPAFYKKVPHETISEAKLALKVQNNKNIKLVIQNLSNSENNWIKEAANLANDLEHQ